MKQDNYLELLSVFMFLLILAAVFAVAYQRDALKQEAVDRVANRHWNKRT
jgi:hypothetical protein